MSIIRGVAEVIFDAGIGALATVTVIFIMVKAFDLLEAIFQNEYTRRAVEFIVNAIVVLIISVLVVLTGALIRGLL